MRAAGKGHAVRRRGRQNGRACAGLDVRTAVDGTFVVVVVYVCDARRVEDGGGVVVGRSEAGT